jgi:malate dehydrogenase
VIAKKGATIFAPGNAIARMVRAILWDRKEIVPCSTLLEGEYGLNGICIGVPAVLGSGGVERVLEIKLTDRERDMFNRGADTLKEAVASLPPL